MFMTGSSSSLAMRSEEKESLLVLGASLVSWKASHDAMASTAEAEIVNEDKRIVSIL